MKFKKLKRPKIRIRRPRVRIRWRKRTSKWVIGIVVFFFVSLFAFQLVLMNYAKSILQNILNLQVEQATDGRYSSSFDDIEVSYTDKSLIIKNFLLVPRQDRNEGQLQTSDTLTHDMFEIFAPSVKIRNINLRKAYFQNSLEIGSLELDRPEITVKADFDIEKTKDAFLLEQDLYKLLPAGIKEFYIRTVRIKDGLFSINAIKNNESNSIHVSPFLLELNDFHLNENNPDHSEGIFFSDSFFFQADTISGKLANKRYKLHMESLNVSSSDSSAFVRNIQLHPIQEINDLVKDSTLTNIYKIDFSQVYIYGLSLHDLYQTNDLIASEVTVLGPGLDLVNLRPLNPGQKENFKLENLYPAIDKVLKSIQVKNLFLRNGKLSIQEYKKGLQEKLTSDINSVDIKNFILDSLASQNDHKLLYSDQINFKLNNYSLRLSDNLHLLQAQELFFSSGQSQIIAKDFKILPDSASASFDSSGQIYIANAPSINLQGVDMLNAYNNNILNIDSLNLKQPSFTLVRQSKNKAPSPPVPGTAFHEEDLYVLIEDYLYSLNIDKISLQKGLINIKSIKRQSAGAFVTNIRNASLWKFRLDSTSAYQMNKLFYANDFELEIEKYDHLLPDDLHRITADEIGISTLKDKIYISELKIFAGENQYPYPDLKVSNAKTLLNIHVPLLELDEVDILKAYLHKRLEVGSVSIPSPSIQLGTILGSQSERSDLIKSSAIYSLMEDYLEVIRVKELLLKEGQVDLAFYADNEPLIISGRQTEIQVSNFRFDSLTSSNPKRLFFADNVKVKMGDYSTHLPDGVHIISARNFYASTEQQEVKAEEVRIKTGENSYTEEELLETYGQKGYFNLLLPNVQLTGIDFDRAYYQEHLQIDSVFAERPEVRYIYLLNNSEEQKKKKISLQQTSFYEAISPFFELLEINSLIMEGGRFSAIQQEDGKQMETTLLEGISLQMDNYLVDSTSTSDSGRFLFADDIRIKIERYQQELLDKIHTISADKLVLSTALQEVKAEGIRLKPDSKKLQQFNNLVSTSFKSRYNIDLPSLEINGIGFDEAYKNGKLKISELLLHNPEIRIRHHLPQKSISKGKNKNGIANYDFYELIRGNLKSLEIDEAKILNGHGDYTQFSGLANPFQVAADDFDAFISNLIIDEKQENQDKLLYADDVRLSVNRFERKLSDSLHVLKMDELKVSTMLNEIEVLGAEIIPRYEQDLLQLMNEKGADKLFHIRIPQSKFSGIDTELLQKDSILLQNIWVRDAKVDLYRYPHVSKAVNENKTDRDWQQQILSSFKLIHSNSISFENAGLTLTTINEKQDSSSFRINNVEGLATNFKFDSMASKSPERLFFSDRLQCSINDYTALLDDELYMLKISSIQLDTRTSNAFADSISLTPMVDRKTFARTKGYETDQFTFRNKKLTLVNLDYRALLQGSFLADSLLLDGFVMHIYRDKRQPQLQNKSPKMPQEMIRDLGPKVILKGMAIRNGYLAYEEQAKGARGTGFIDLTNLQIKSDTITNDSTLLARGLVTNIKLECRLMGTGQLEAFFEIPLGDSLNRHIYYGSLDEMNLSDFNPILKKTVFIQIRNGHAEHIDFHVEADRNMAKGFMNFYYRDLNVALVNKKTGRTGGPIKQVGSLIANWLVVNTNNTAEGEKPFKKGEIAFERDKGRSTVNYWVKTLVNGFKSSIGL